MSVPMNESMESYLIYMGTGQLEQLFVVKLQYLTSKKKPYPIL